MQKIVPEILKAGDEVRIVAPARGIKLIGKDAREIAAKRFAEWGLKLTFGKNTIEENWDMFGSSSVDKRVEDLMDAFADTKVKAIFTVIGGTNSNKLLPYLDYEMIKKNPKILCGFSDITALLNGIYAQTGMVTFSGPHYSSLGMLKGAEYTIENLQKMIMGVQENVVEPSLQWSDDLWFLDQENRTFIDNEGYWVLQGGKAKGTIIGGNLGTFNLLLGSKFCPAFADDTILFIEDCLHSESQDVVDFERNLQALCYQEEFKKVRAVVIGRFQKGSNMSKEKLAYIVETQRALEGIPVIANVDFGHTTPLLTIPIGGECALDTSKNKLILRV